MAIMETIETRILEGPVAMTTSRTTIVLWRKPAGTQQSHDFFGKSGGTRHLKLTMAPGNRHFNQKRPKPKKKLYSIPTIHFQVLELLVSGRVKSMYVTPKSLYKSWPNPCLIETSREKIAYLPGT